MIYFVIQSTFKFLFTSLHRLNNHYITDHANITNQTQRQHLSNRPFSGACFIRHLLVADVFSFIEYVQLFHYQFPDYGLLSCTDACNREVKTRKRRTCTAVPAVDTFPDQRLFP